MTNYNDGQWHGWNGGECPVHPETRVHGVESLGANSVTWKTEAKDNDWPSFRGAFRVTKEHKEPREFWIVNYDASAWDTEDQAVKWNDKLPQGGGIIHHVREVT